LRLDGQTREQPLSPTYLPIRYSERLDESDIVASVGSRGDSYDNAMAESFNSLYKWELIYPQGPWRGLDDVEYATLGYIDWFNHRRLHGEITEDNSYVTPAEFEAIYYRQNQPALEAVTDNPSSHGTRGGSLSSRRGRWGKGWPSTLSWCSTQTPSNDLWSKDWPRIHPGLPIEQICAGWRLSSPPRPLGSLDPPSCHAGKWHRPTPRPNWKCFVPMGIARGPPRGDAPFGA